MTGAVPGSDPPDEATRIRQAVVAIEDRRARLHASVLERDQDRAAWDEWMDAASGFREALAQLYSKAFWDGLERLRTGDPDAVEPAIVFLEVDPWCFRSGYAKETILRYLQRAELTDDQAIRLRVVVLQHVDVGDRREFRSSCRLARHVIDDGLRVALIERLRSDDRARARRALWVLDAVRAPLGPDDRVAAQAVLEAAAADPTWWRVAHWVRPYVGRYGDQDWLDLLLVRAIDGGSDAGPALRLLSAVRVRPSDEQRAALAELVLHEIEFGDDDSWLESTARLADAPPFRTALADAYRSASTSDIRRRAAWAINAIRRTATDRWPDNPLDGA